MKKTIDQMSRLLEHDNISLPEGASKDNSGYKNEDHERCHELKARFSKSHGFLIDSGPFNHMVASKESLSSLKLTDGPSTHMRDDTKMKLNERVQTNLCMECSMISCMCPPY